MDCTCVTEAKVGDMICLRCGGDVPTGACKHGVPAQNICDECELGPMPKQKRKWRVSYCNGRPYSQITDTDTGELIAEAYGTEARAGLANALFIAAAPEMCEALNAALDVMTSKKVTIEEQADAITLVRRALERAEGKR
jgi:hypothetical protein